MDAPLKFTSACVFSKKHVCYWIFICIDFVFCVYLHGIVLVVMIYSPIIQE